MESIPAAANPAIAQAIDAITQRTHVLAEQLQLQLARVSSALRTVSNGPDSRELASISLLLREAHSLVYGPAATGLTVPLSAAAAADPVQSELSLEEAALELTALAQAAMHNIQRASVLLDESAHRLDLWFGPRALGAGAGLPEPTTATLF